MFRLATVAALVLSAGTAHAVSVSSSSLAEFQSLAADADEIAVGELRGGNARTNGTFEADLRGDGRRAERQFAWAQNVKTAFRFDYFAGPDELTLTLGEGEDAVRSVQTGLGIGDTRTLFVRARSDVRGDTAGSTVISGLTFNGRFLDVVSPIEAMGDEQAWAKIQGDEFASDFKITGNITFDFPGDTTPNSAFASQFKFTDVEAPAPVPVPAAGALLLAGLGALGAARRRA